MVTFVVETWAKVILFYKKQEKTDIFFKITFLY